MFEIDALPAFNDNYIWLLKDASRRRCAVVDPGDAVPVQHWLDANPGWQLESILITHHHRDHVGGVEALTERTGATVFGPANESIPNRNVALTGGESISVLGHAFHVLAVPGHTLGHIAYVQNDHQVLFCGDTLFAGGCGRLFEGTPEQMHASLTSLSNLPAQTRVFCAHEYTLSNLRFAITVEPGNVELLARYEQAQTLRAAGQSTVPSTIGLERATNPFLRTDQPSVIQAVQQQTQTDKELSATEVFATLRSWKDRF